MLIHYYVNKKTIKKNTILHFDDFQHLFVVCIFLKLKKKM